MSQLYPRQSRLLSKPIFLFLLVLGMELSAKAQSPEAAIQISGNVKDSAQKPLESATVSLLRTRDSVLILSVVTDKKGHFGLELSGQGPWLLRVSEIGYLNSYSTISKKIDQINNLFNIELHSSVNNLKEVAVIGRKPFIEQKPDRMLVNVDASPSNAGSIAMDILEKSPGVTVDKDGNISLKGKQGVTILIDNKPTYMTATQLASYLKSLPAAALDQIEIMTNPSAKYDAAGNSGIINIKTKKNRAKGFNGSVNLTHTQGVYPKPGGSINLNYRTGKVNLFANANYTYWEGFQDLHIMRSYYDTTGKFLNSIFSQNSFIRFQNPELNVKAGIDYFLSSKTTLGIVLSGFQNAENDQGSSTIYLKNPDYVTDSIVYSPSTNNSTWKSGTVNFNFRHQFDSLGTELTADLDLMTYAAGSSQYFDNITYTPAWVELGVTQLTGNLPSRIHIYSFKSDYSETLASKIKLETGIKSSYVTTDNIAEYDNIVGGVPVVDTTKTNHFVYRENINAAYINLNKQYGKWNVQAGLRLENTNYSGHQFGNSYTVISNDSAFQRSYLSLFPTLFLSYQASSKNQFTLNYGRRIDRPAYQDLNPFLFFLDEYTYQAGNPYLQPQFTHNLELAHTYNNCLTTTLNYSYTVNYFSETFQQSGHATIVRNGNIGSRQNAGISVSAQIKPWTWWTVALYGDFSYTQFQGVLYGQAINIGAPNFLANVNNNFQFAKGWGGEISGFYRSSGVDGQVLVNPMGQASAAVSKQVLKEKGSLKLGLRDIFYTNIVTGQINFQQTQASFRNERDSRQLSLSFTYRFGKPIKGAQPHRQTGGASDEQNRIKSGGNN